MRAEMQDREIMLGRHIALTGQTVRETAKQYGVSKSTVHKDVTERLFYTDRALYKAVKKVLEKNKSERHIRGGNATREKYRRQKS